MSTIIADPTVQQWLAQLADVTEIHDAQGNLLGLFTPKPLVEEQMIFQKAMQLLDPVEIERRLREEHGKGAPLAEVWKRLAALEKS